MQDKFFIFIKNYKSIEISLSDLEGQADAEAAYTSFSQTVQQLMEEGYLVPIKKHGYNTKEPPLPLTYRIQKSLFTQPLKQEIQSYQLLSHQSIVLDHYFKSSESKWRRDLPYIHKVNEFLKNHGILHEEASAPERSYQIMGDEKWIDEKGGKKFLEDISVWQLMKISSVPDPLMLAINPERFLHSSKSYHLIVENKATYYALLPVLSELNYTTLVYGAGWKIVSGIENHLRQIGYSSKSSANVYHYFGDLDHEGISIWNVLYEKMGAVPAASLYQSMLLKSYGKGKETQRVNVEALAHFLLFFPEHDQAVITRLLAQGFYIPQEALSIEALRNHVREQATVVWGND